jgi:hypothetical protein
VLTADSLKTALDFLDFLEQREEEDATEELERIPGFAKQMAEAERDIAAGRVTAVEKLRRKYKPHV